MAKTREILIGLLVITAVAISVLISGCIGEKPEIEGQPEEEWELSSDKFVFIERYTHIHGELIEGDDTRVMIDFPFYRFDEETGDLRGWITFDINGTLKAVYGGGSSLSGAAGGGVATRLYGVYELPYDNHGFKILKIDPDGTAHLEYKNVAILLKSGEKWVNISSKIDTRESGDRVSKLNLTTTVRITNHGILNKSKLGTWGKE